MNLQEHLDNYLTAKRAENMKTSAQLMLGECILMLEAVSDKSLPVIFDVEPFSPDGLDSWRGSYAELSLAYRVKGDNQREVSWLLQLLKQAVGQTYGGYKGGEFLMGKNTPIWVANYSMSNGFREGGETAVVGITELENMVVITTEAMEY